MINNLYEYINFVNNPL